MKGKMLVVALGAMVSISVAFAGCKGGNTAGGTNEPAKSNAPAAAEAQPAATGADAVAKALCEKWSDVMTEQMKKAPDSAHGGDPQKMADEMEKNCVDEFNKLPAEQKEAEGKKADEALKTCGDKAGDEFMKCVDPILSSKKQ